VRGTPSPYNRPETIEETAVLVAAAGGTAIPVRVDHTVEPEVAALFARVRDEHGRLDVLADSVGGESPLLGGWGTLVKTDLSQAPAALTHCLVSHVLTARHAVPVMSRGGLIAQVTEHDLLFAGGNVVVGLVKSGLKSLAALLAEELRKPRVTVVAITPGFLRSESMLAHFGVTEATWREAGKKDPHFLHSESPLFVGRAVAALAADRAAFRRSGEIVSSWELARVYGFTDANGERPDWGAHFRDEVVPSMAWVKSGLERHVAWLEGLAARGREYLGEAPAAARA
jgi:NAD(P)-dependent dehydrogenase (short-subunit alcohol dehydrogenase family)